MRCAVDDAKRRAIEACGNCRQPEDAHKFDGSVARDDLALFAALGGPCTAFVASDAAVLYAKHLAIVDNREPQRQPGRIAKRNPPCPRCTHRHRGDCVIAPGPLPGKDTASRGAAKAREALGLASQDDQEAS